MRIGIFFIEMTLVFTVYVKDEIKNKNSVRTLVYNFKLL
jgi:hypothetical protein